MFSYHKNCHVARFCILGVNEKLWEIFQEIENKGKLEDFLDRFMTKEEFSETVIIYLEEKSKE